MWLWFLEQLVADLARSPAAARYRRVLANLGRELGIEVFRETSPIVGVAQTRFRIDPGDEDALGGLQRLLGDAFQHFSHEIHPDGQSGDGAGLVRAQRLGL